MTRDLFGPRRVHLLNAKYRSTKKPEMLSAMRCRVQNRREFAQKGSQENAFVTLGYVGPRLVYEIAVYEFKIGREKPLIIAVRSHRGLFSALSGICQ
jgi:hypothetical protein